MDDWSHIPARNAVSEPAPDLQSTMTATTLFPARLTRPRQAPRRRLDSLLSLIGDFDREITATTREIDARAKTDERVKVLCQIRGIGRATPRCS